MATIINQPPEILEQLFVDLVTPIPLEWVVSLDTNGSTKLPEELFCMMPNIETMRISCVELSKGFLQPDPDGPYATTKLLPSLRLLRLEYVVLQGGDDWGHLMTYLAHQTLDGQTISLELIGQFPRTGPVVDGIKDLVKELTFFFFFRFIVLRFSCLCYTLRSMRVEWVGGVEVCNQCRSRDASHLFFLVPI